MYHNRSVHMEYYIERRNTDQSSAGAASLTSLLNVGNTYLFWLYESNAHMTMQSIEPRVLMVEEAGQVLEAHILASLVPSGVSRTYPLFWPHCFRDSVHHLICIGDPRQLRPSLATYSVLNIFHSMNERWHAEFFSALSVESAVGRELYKFDRSLMERLSDAQFPMSQINVQRRMRPEISHLIRYVYSSLLLCWM